MERKHTEEQYTWDLTHLYPSEKEWRAEYRQVEELLPRFQIFKGKLNQPVVLLDCLRTDEEVSLYVERLYVYASLWKDEDTRNSDAQRLVEKVVNLSTKVGEATSFIVPELMEMKEDELLRMLDEKEELQIYRKMVQGLVRSKPHILSETEEALLAQLGDTYGVGSDVFSMLNDADMEFPIIETADGEMVKLTKSNYSLFVESPDRAVRERAYKALYETYMRFKHTIGTTLYANIKENVTHAKIRKYPTALEKALFRNDVPLEVFLNLLDTTKKQTDSLQKYVAIRKKALGVSELRMWDMYVPIVQNVEQKITYEEAYKKMTEGLSVLGEDYVSLLYQAKENRWIDVYENDGKRGGAYSWGAYGTHPYVLLNHREDLDSLFTLAHEMGHALHSHYSDEANEHLYAQYTIFVAEVASTVNEVLLMHHLLNQAKEKGEKEMEIYLLNHFLEQFRGTLYRQAMFAEFEYLTHQKVEEGYPLTHEDFRDIYLSLHKTYYGDQVVHDEEISYEWMRIPHFYTPYYVYQYATGFSAAIAIANRILKEGQPAVDDYKRFLKSGGTDYPIEQLKIAGVDMSRSETVEAALGYFTELVNRFENLMME